MEFHSATGLITNSSSEVFVVKATDLENAIYDALDRFLKHLGSDRSARDIFVVDLRAPGLENPDGYSSTLSLEEVTRKYIGSLPKEERKELEEYLHELGIRDVYSGLGWPDKYLVGLIQFRDEQKGLVEVDRDIHTSHTKMGRNAYVYLRAKDEHGLFYNEYGFKSKNTAISIESILEIIDFQPFFIERTVS